MISLHAYLTPKEGNEEALESAIRDKWIAAMAEQPGFSSAVMLTPFPDEELMKLNALKPRSTYEVVSFWRSESDRKAWVARPIHDQVFSQVEDAADSITFTLQTVEHSWNLQDPI